MSSEEGGVSRRDFLRRAGKQAAKEAVEVGTNVVPGGAVIRHLLKDTPLVNKETEEEEPKSYLAPLKNPLRWFAALRARREEPKTDESEDGA